MWSLRDLNPRLSDYESAVLTNWTKGPLSLQEISRGFRNRTYVTTLWWIVLKIAVDIPSRKTLCVLSILTTRRTRNIQLSKMVGARRIRTSNHLILTRQDLTCSYSKCSLRRFALPFVLTAALLYYLLPQSFRGDFTVYPPSHVLPGNFLPIKLVSIATTP